MVRKLLFILGRSLLIVSFGLGGCVSLDSRNGAAPENEAAESESGTASESEKGKSGFSLAGLFSGKKKKKDEPEKPEPPSGPIPQKIPIGTVHLVHDQGGFVLIQSTQPAKVPPQAELMTYSQEGKPTGKLRISPERKGNLLVADILQGHPQANDRVMLFGMTGADGTLVLEADPVADAGEVLE